MTLAQLKRAGLVEDRRSGKHVLYRLSQEARDSRQLRDLLAVAATELPEAKVDAGALRLVLRKRQDKMRAYFDQLAGKFGRHYVPGRSWKALAEALLALLPPMVIADLGAGEGTLAQLLAARARQVIAVDNAEKMVAFGRELARSHGLANLDYRLGDLEALPIDDGSVDLALFSQSLHHAVHPDRAIREAWRIVRSGGRVAILDLKRHQFEEARELYADLWLGFTEAELIGLLDHAGFTGVTAAAVDRETSSPHLETILVTAGKPETA